MRPDLIVSGINRGSNIGTDVLYSGTVSAALEGLILGIPAIAVSLDEWENLDYSVAAGFARYLAEQAIKNHLPADTLLNINVPPCSAEQIAGVRVTKLGDRRYRSFYEQRQDPRGRHYYWLAGEPIAADNDLTTDVGAVRENYISVTPLHFDLTNHAMVAPVTEWQLAFDPATSTMEE
jgi:5'-nucleotidase